MPLLNRWLEYFDLMRVRYSHSLHPPAQTARETVAAERMPAHELAKPVVYCGDKGFGIAVVPADRLVDLEQVACMLGLSRIRLANEAELVDLYPDCERGAMPPLGDACPMPVIVDDFVASEFIAFTIGTHRDIVRMSFADYQRLAHPKVAVIALGRAVAA